MKYADKIRNYQRSRADLIKSIIDFHDVEKPQTLTAQLEALCAFAYSCGHELGIYDGYKLSRQGENQFKSAHTNCLTSEEINRLDDMNRRNMANWEDRGDDGD